MLRRLKQKHEVTYLALVNGPSEQEQQQLEQANEYSDRLVTVPWRERRKFKGHFYLDLLSNLWSPLPYAIEKYCSREMQQSIERELQSNSYDVTVCDFLVPSINLPRGGTGATVLFQHNVESVIWQRHYENQSNRIKRAYVYGQWQKMLAYESRTCRAFNVVAAVSPNDRDFMKNEYGVQEVYDVPTGVDTEYFRPSGATRDSVELVFTGSMDWLPNEDAITYFAEKILPRIAAVVPDVKLTVVGRNPAKSLQSLARLDNRVRVTGRVEDIRPYVNQAAVYVVPLRVGGGTRLKIYEAMAMGKPVVSTSIGAEGLPVRSGEELLVADDPEQFAGAVLRLLSDCEFAERLGRRGCAAVRERFSWDSAATVFTSICARACNRKARVRAA